MPVPGFLSSFADKAQSAVAQHLPSSHRSSSPDSSPQPSANSAAQGGTGVGHRNPAFEAIQHQLRSLGQQYGSTTPVQKIITTEKGVVIDYESVSRNAKAQSKELYTWGQSEDEDLKDVTDRLAYLNFVQGSLASSLATKLDAARAPLKALRDAETSLAPRRSLRAGLHTQLARIEHENQRGMEKKIIELKDQIKKAELDDEPLEKEVELLKRKGVRESEQLKWDAIREYGEKLVLLSQAAHPVLEVLPTLPPTPDNPYTGAQATGAARASLQRALDNYKTGHINLPSHPSGSDLSRSDTRSFGESHASELSSMNSSDTLQSGHPDTSAKAVAQSTPPPTKANDSPSPGKAQSPPINPSNLNHSPAPLPSSGSNALSTTSPAPIASPDPSKPSPALPAITPTVAETGTPVSAGIDGPGPAQGSLRDIRSPTSTAGSGTAPSDALPKWESAEEEKKRLASQYSQASQRPTETSAPQYESAEDEKKRREREERENVSRAQSQSGGSGSSEQPPKRPGDDEELPPYQDI